MQVKGWVVSNPQLAEFPSLSDIPAELFPLIFSFLRPIDCVCMSLTARRYKQIINNEFWLDFRMKYLPIFHAKEDFYIPFLEGCYFAFKLRQLEVLELVYSKNINPRISFLHYNETAIFILNSFCGITRISLDSLKEENQAIEDVCFIRCMTAIGHRLYVASQFRNTIAIYDNKTGNFQTDEMYQDITSLAVHQNILFALERHRVVMFDLVDQKSQVLECISNTFWGHMAFSYDYFFVSYTDGRGNLGFLAKNFQTNSAVEALCFGLKSGFCGYELLGSELFLKFNNGDVKAIDLKTLQETTFSLHSKLIKVIKSQKEYWFFCLDKNSILSICDDKENILFKTEEAMKREKRLGFYKGYLILGLSSGIIEIWNVLSKEKLFQFKPFPNGFAITTVRVVLDKLVVTSSMGNLHIYSLLL